MGISDGIESIELWFMEWGLIERVFEKVFGKVFEFAMNFRFS